MPPLRVLHVITGLPTGGAEMMLLKLCTSLNRASFENHVVSLIGTQGSMLRSRFEAADIPVTSLGMRSAAGLPQGGIELARIVRRVRPNLVQGWLAHGNLAATLAQAVAPGRAALLWNVRQSLDLARDRDARPTTSLAIKIGARLSSRPRAIIYNSKTARAQHESIGYNASRGVDIANGFDLSMYAPSELHRAAVRAELQLPAGTQLIGLLARYHPMKDHANFLRAARILLDTRGDVRFLMAGPGIVPSNSELMAVVEELGLEPYTYLLGERADTQRINAALDVATSASRTIEGFSNAIGEAMACGVPCVVTDVGDAAWLVEKQGIVVPPEDSTALAAGWNQILSLSPQERQALGAAARQRIVTHFSIAVIARQYADLYERLAER